MTAEDSGSNRPGDPADTRQLIERVRTESGDGVEVSGRAFVIALVCVLAVLVGLVVAFKV